jgi:hypothetical protein
MKKPLNNRGVESSPVDPKCNFVLTIAVEDYDFTSAYGYQMYIPWDRFGTGWIGDF